MRHVASRVAMWKCFTPRWRRGFCAPRARCCLCQCAHHHARRRSTVLLDVYRGFDSMTTPNVARTQNRDTSRSSFGCCCRCCYQHCTRFVTCVSIDNAHVLHAQSRRRVRATHNISVKVCAMYDGVPCRQCERAIVGRSVTVRARTATKLLRRSIHRWVASGHRAVRASDIVVRGDVPRARASRAATSMW
jgi:hypothetical protein